MSFKAQSRIVVLLVSFTALILIVFNIYSSKIRSSIRAYINGESMYSKGQKDGLLNLTNYLNTGDTTYWHGYVESLKVPQSDNKARHAMINNEPDSVVHAYFLAGGIHPDDIGNLIWMFKNFRDIPAFKHAIDQWSKSEVILLDLAKTANEVKYDIENGIMNESLKNQLFVDISKANTQLTGLEIAFSSSLSGLARKIEKMLNYVNIMVIILAVGSLSAYLMMVISKLYKSKKQLKISYDKVYDLNLELDTFVYSLSHDLRAPLTSLQGLVKIAVMETRIAPIKEYISLMDGLLEKQDVFLRDVIALLQRRDLTPQCTEINIELLLKDTFSLNNHKLNTEGIKTNVSIEKDMQVIYSDIVFVKIIFNNLISNAFKYNDSNKPDRFINVRGRDTAEHLIFEIEDNGIGIAKEFHDKIFEMFYVIDSSKRGTGLGLYIIKQSVNKLNGTISLSSTVGEGSKFVISLPKIAQVI